MADAYYEQDEEVLTPYQAKEIVRRVFKTEIDVDNDFVFGTAVGITSLKADQKDEDKQAATSSDSKKQAIMATVDINTIFNSVGKPYHERTLLTYILTHKIDANFTKEDRLDCFAAALVLNANVYTKDTCHQKNALDLAGKIPEINNVIQSKMHFPDDEKKWKEVYFKNKAKLQSEPSSQQSFNSASNSPSSGSFVGIFNSALGSSIPVSHSFSAIYSLSSQPITQAYDLRKSQLNGFRPESSNIMPEFDTALANLDVRATELNNISATNYDDTLSVLDEVIGAGADNPVVPIETTTQPEVKEITEDELYAQEAEKAEAEQIAILQSLTTKKKRSSKK